MFHAMWCNSGSELLLISRSLQGMWCALHNVHVYRIAGYIGRNNVWRIVRKRKKIAIGGYSTIATPSPGVYAVGAILVDLILAV